MIIDLRKVFITDNYSLPITATLDLTDFDYMGGYPLKTSVSINGTVSNKAGLVTLSLTMVYVFSAPCDRCGLPTAATHKVTLEKSLAPEIVGEDSDDIITVPDMKLDVDDLAYTEVVLSLPMKHLCTKTCKGLCTKCGKNLNEGECSCNKGEIDPRWQALADLLKD